MLKFKIGDYINFTYSQWHLINCVIIVKNITELDYEILLSPGDQYDTRLVRIPIRILEDHGVLSFKHIFKNL